VTSPPTVTVPRARPGRWFDASVATVAAVAAGGLIGGALCGFGHGVEGMSLWLAGGIVALLMFVRWRRAATAPPTRIDPPSGPTAGDDPRGDSSLERGVRDIRRTDPGFDPLRFVGYAGTVFRDTQIAWVTRNIGPLRDRVTSEIHRELQAQCDRLRNTGRANRVERIEIMAEVTDAWQESGRDYVTAYIGGSLVDYTVDEVSDSLVAGSRTSPRGVEEFWTFTRPAGLNFWMLSAIQTFVTPATE
jgi:predicted lipid-binding transport protein (Tim44 family)